MKKLTIVFLLILSIPLFGQWVKINMPPLKYVDKISPTLIGLQDSTIFVKAIALYMSTNYGKSWDEIPTDFDIKTYSLFFSSDKVIIVTGDTDSLKNVFFRSIDKGLTWSLIDIAEFDYKNYKNIIEVNNDNSTYLIAFSIGMDNFMYSSDYGITWQKDQTNITPYSSNSNVAVVGKNLFTYNSVGKILASDNLGKSWKLIDTYINDNKFSTTKLIAVKSNLFLATNVGLYKSSNLGESWTLALQDSKNNIILDLSTDGETLFSSYRDWSTNNPIDIYFMSIDNGISWTQIPFNYLPGGVIMNSKNYVALKSSYYLFYSKNKGITWENEITNFTNESSYSINSFTCKNGNLFLVTSNPSFAVCTSSDDGITWSPIELTQWNIQQYVDSNTNAFYLGKYSFYKTTANTWESYPIPQGYPCPIHDCVTTYVYGFVPCNDNLIIGGTTGIKYYNNQDPISTSCSGSTVYWLTSYKNNIYASCDCGILISSDCGITWKTIFQYFVPSRIIVNDYFICGINYDGWLCLSSDNGESWNYFHSGIKGIIDIGLNENMFYIATITDSWRVNLDYLITNIEPRNYPTTFSLSQNYPNPFNPETTIEYSIPKSEHVTLKIYDLLGREVATLVNEFKQAGTYNSRLNTHNYKLPSGVYFYRLQAGSYRETKKLILMK